MHVLPFMASLARRHSCGRLGCPSFTTTGECLQVTWDKAWATASARAVTRARASDELELGLRLA